MRVPLAELFGHTSLLKFVRATARTAKDNVQQPLSYIELNPRTLSCPVKDM